ncbi:MAG: hypothetical protein R3B13_21230 [Polyangiaceae bacterium]
MSVTTELVIKAGLGALVAALIATRVDARRHGRVVFGVLAVVSAAAFFNFGAFHGARYAHHGELFHYVLGSKYFAELGYDGLYAASLEASGNAPISRPAPVRDLRSYQRVDRSSLQDHRQQVRGRFSDSRWNEFVGDHGYLVENSEPAYVDAWRKDHGYNATPAWTTLARVFNWFPVSRGAILFWTLLDPLLLAVMFWALWRTFGFVPTALSLCVFGLAYLSRFYWVGGAFLRHDWLCASVVGVCLLERKRPGWAGLCFGYAAAMRVFPALLLFGIFVHALARWKRGDRNPWPLWLGASFACTVAGLVLAGALAGRGFDAWSEFASAIELHRSHWSRNRVGSFTSLMYAYDFVTRPASEWGTVVSADAWQAKVDAFRANWWPLRGVVTVAWLAGVARVAWTRPRVECAALGLVSIFALTEPTSYYWSLLLLIPFVGRRWLTVMTLAVSSLLCAVGAATGMSFVYAVAAYALFALFALWLMTRTANGDVVSP